MIEVDNDDPFGTDDGDTVMTTPWDMRPSFAAQHHYIREAIRRIANADLTKVDRTMASQAIDQLNSVRRSLGVPYEEF